MAEDMPYRIPRKVFREFNPRCPKLHFTFSSLPPSSAYPSGPLISIDDFEVTALHGSVWDSSTQTLPTGWSTPVDREILAVRFKFRHADPSESELPIQQPATDADILIIAIEALSTGGAVFLLSPESRSGLTSLSTDLTNIRNSDNTNLIDLVHSEFPQIFDDLLLNWMVPHEFLMELGSGPQRAWRVRVVVEEKTKVTGIPATRPVLKIGDRNLGQQTRRWGIR